MKNNKNTAAAAAELITPTIEALGCSLWDIEYVKEGADMILRITIDNKDGVNIEHCEAVSRAIDPLLDEAAIIEGHYILEVSSPGVERELRLDWHYTECIGERVRLMLFAPIDGTRRFEGVLEDFKDGTITLNTGSQTITIERAAVSKSETVFDWNTK